MSKINIGNVHKLDWSNFRVCLAVNRARGIAAAAQILNSSPQTVRRRLDAIESVLGTPIFVRLASGYEVTAAGRAILDTAQQMEELSANLGARIRMLEEHPTGTVVISTGTSVTFEIVRKNIGKFNELYPDVQLELIVTDRVVDLALREADLAVRPEDTTSRVANLTRQHFCDIGFAVYGSNDYLDSHPPAKTFEDLQRHKVIMHDRSRLFYFRPLNWVADQIKPKSVPLITNDLWAAHDAACQGVGLAVLPCVIADKRPELIRVIGGHESFKLPLWLYMHRASPFTPAIRTFIDFIVAAAKSDAQQLLGSP